MRLQRPQDHRAAFDAATNLAQAVRDTDGITLELFRQQIINRHAQAARCNIQPTGEAFVVHTVLG
ncbi:MULTISPECIES: hypothetical protein [Pseudomonas]|uniref:hypothetical protein n=1 Tax=Pseudomonas TaxID=286 RepID=UPI00108227DF|nr:MULTISPECIES: hypothetical protein [Pseudomonas]MBG4910289.1 hypothetical protein [Pseudomonas aeruginosa]UUC52298.1 hypothetical protein NOX82_10415 [Pseudomonas citronellolis]HCF4943854.1 hypothetical protein [Pseudomonas aeruginosa]HCF6594810.1 hypothetical protein [Pseudomonas aeruginosa]